MNWPSAGERVSGGGALTVSWRKGTKKIAYRVCHSQVFPSRPRPVRGGRTKKAPGGLSVWRAFTILACAPHGPYGRGTLNAIRHNMQTLMTHGRLLWVDDEVNMLKAHLIFLEKKGYEVVTTTNGYDAIELCQQMDFDLVLLDENMPG